MVEMSLPSSIENPSIGVVLIGRLEQKASEAVSNRLPIEKLSLYR
jgi:hypothetical protein